MVAAAEVGHHHHHHIEEAEEDTEVEEEEEEEEDHVDIIPTDVMIMEVDDTLVADVIIDMIMIGEGGIIGEEEAVAAAVGVGGILIITADHANLPIDSPLKLKVSIHSMP